MNKKEEYQSRQKEWRDLSLSQLSSVNNTFTTLALGFLAFVYKDDMLASVTFRFIQTDIKLTLISFSFTMLIVSIVLGLLILLTRLYDFRISRHLALTRQRMINNDQTDGFLPENIDRDYNLCDRLMALWKIIFFKIDFITKSEIRNQDKSYIVNKFTKLQELSSVLGSSTWKWLKFQILLFLLSIVLYGMYIIN